MALLGKSEQRFHLLRATKPTRPPNVNTKVTCSIMFLHSIPKISNRIHYFAEGKRHWQCEILKKGLWKWKVRGWEVFLTQKCLVWRLKLPLLYDWSLADEFTKTDFKKKANERARCLSCYELSNLKLCAALSRYYLCHTFHAICTAFNCKAINEKKKHELYFIVLSHQGESILQKALKI